MNVMQALTAIVDANPTLWNSQLFAAFCTFFNSLLRKFFRKRYFA